QTATGRYNFTDDWREIPVTGGGLFSGLRPRVRAQNISFFLNGNLTAPDSARLILNQLRFSYGRTRLLFPGLRERDFMRPSNRFPGTPLLLNAPLRINTTLPQSPGRANIGDVTYVSEPDMTAEDALGPIGQLIIGGFSPVGVDVFNFPQQ